MRGRLIPLLVAGIVTSAAVTAVYMLWVSVRGAVQNGQPPDPPDPPDPPAVATPAVYVGRQACAVCHTREHDLWQGSHHDLAMQPAGPETVLGNFDDASFTHGGVTSTFTTRDGGFFVKTDGPDGDLREYRITHTFGVTPLQQYLVGFPGGRYQVLPLCWDTRPVNEGGRRWFHLYPDEVIPHGDALHWTGPNQNWNYMCAECHSTNLRKNYDLEHDSYDTTFSEIDVSCEACHGPGSRHVQWSRSAYAGHETPALGIDDTNLGLLVRLRDTDGGGWVMDMSTGTAQRSVPRSSRTEIDTCARCHSRRVQIDEDDLPGQPLLDTYVPALLSERLYHPDGQILDEVYVYGSFLQSRMYAKGVSCSDCHDPHSGRLVARGNALCGQCHLPDRFDTPAHHFHEAEGPASSCVECHMRDRTYMVVDPRRDHSFRIPRPDLSMTLATPNACNQCHTDRSPQWAVDAVDRWYGPRRSHFGDALHAGRTGAGGAAGKLAAVAADAGQPAIVRASALSLLTGSPGAAARAVIESGLADDDALVRLAAVDALAASGSEHLLRLAVPLLGDPVRAVRIRAARALAAVAAGVTDPGLREALEPAMAEYVRSELTNADRPESHVNLGNFYAEQALFGAAEASYLTALGLDAAHVPAHVNLADLHRARGRDDKGEPLLRRAVEIDPGSAAAHHALGLLLVRQGLGPQAIESFRRACELAPDNTRFGYVYAVSLHSAGRPADAMEELERTHAVSPVDRDVLAALVTFHREAGNLDAAIGFAEELVAAAPDDPGGVRLLEELRADGELKGTD